MNNDDTPTTNDIRKCWADSTETDLSREERQAQFDNWYEAEMALAWNQGQRAEARSWEHILGGHPVAEGEMCGECAVVNPYIKGTT